MCVCMRVCVCLCVCLCVFVHTQTTTQHTTDTSTHKPANMYADKYMCTCLTLWLVGWKIKGVITRRTRLRTDWIRGDGTGVSRTREARIRGARLRIPSTFRGLHSMEYTWRYGSKYKSLDAWGLNNCTYIRNAQYCPIINLSKHWRNLN